MAMFPFCGSVLLMCMWAGNMVINTYSLKERVEALVFTTPISLNSLNLLLKESFNKVLEIMEFCKDFRFVF
jgi:hypothetical protein